MTTFCSKCEKEITENEKEDSMFVICKDCHRSTAKGVLIQKKNTPVNDTKIKPHGPNLKDALKGFMKDKEKVNLNQIYTGIGANKDSIRAILNLSVKNNGDFMRVGKGEYSLRK